MDVTQIRTKRKGLVNFKVKSPISLLYGKRRSGKTYYLNKYVKKNYKKYFKIFIFKNTLLEGAYTFKEKIMKKVVLAQFDLDKVQAVAKLQQMFKKQKKRRPFLIIFDDVLDSMNIDERRQMEIFGMNGRHYGYLEIIFVAQTITKFMSPAFRSNFDYIIVFKIPRGIDADTVRREFLGLNNNDFLVMKHKMQTTKYLKIVIDDIDDQVYYLK